MAQPSRILNPATDFLALVTIGCCPGNQTRMSLTALSRIFLSPICFANTHVECNLDHFRNLHGARVAELLPEMSEHTLCRDIFPEASSLLASRPLVDNLVCQTCIAATDVHHFTRRLEHTAPFVHPPSFLTPIRSPFPVTGLNNATLETCIGHLTSR